MSCKEIESKSFSLFKTVNRISDICYGIVGPAKIRAQILSGSSSSTPSLLNSFLCPGAYRTGEGRL